jgi:hypothetical protein
MKIFKASFMILVSILIVSSTVLAGDFDWMKDCNIKAEADESGFRVRLRTRFKISDAEVDAVLSNTDKPADAYMLLRLGEMSQKSTNDVIKRYKANKGKGWGALAKSLGIKPGSEEFHALKKGQDIYTDTGGKCESKEKGKGKGKGKGKK